MAHQTYVRFSNYPINSERKEFYKEFLQFGQIRKLYLDPEGKFGKVYFVNKEDADLAYKGLTDNSSLNLIFEPPTTVSDFQDSNSLEIAKDSFDENNKNFVTSRSLSGSASTSNMDFLDEDLLAEPGPKLVDMFGRTVNTLVSDDDEIYVPLKEVKQAGYDLFDISDFPANGKIADYDEHLVKQFEMYMQVKANKFMMQNAVKIPGNIVNRAINRSKNKIFDRSFDGPQRKVTVDDHSIKITTPSGQDPQSSDVNRNSYKFNSFKRNVQDDSNQLRLRTPHATNSNLKNSPLNASDKRPYASHNSQNQSAATRNVGQKVDDSRLSQTRNFDHKTDNARSPQLRNYDQKPDDSRSPQTRNFGQKFDGARPYQMRNSEQGTNNTPPFNQRNDNARPSQMRNFAQRMSDTQSPQRRSFDQRTDDNVQSPQMRSFGHRVEDKRTPQMRNSGQGNDSPQMRNSVQENDSPQMSSTLTSPNKSPPPLTQLTLKMNSFQKVTVVHIENKCKGWVQNADDDVLKMLANITQAAAEGKPIQPQIGLICAAQFEGLWFRVIVLGINPTEVRYIDYGNKNTEPLKEVRALSDDMTVIPAQAVRVQLEPGQTSALQADAVMNVKPIKLDENGTYIVQLAVSNEVAESKIETKIVQSNVPTATVLPKILNLARKSEQLEAKNSSPSSTSNGMLRTPPINKDSKELQNTTTNKNIGDSVSPKPDNVPVKDFVDLNPSRKSAVDVFINNDTGFLECTEVIDSNTFVAFILPSMLVDKVNLLEDLTNDCVPNPDASFNVGDTVAVKKDKDYVRATIINIVDNKYITALIDYGLVETIEEIRLLPKKYTDIPEFTCVVTVDPNYMNDIKTESSDISVAINESGNVILNLKNGRKCEVKVERWNPFLTSPLAVPLPKHFKIKSNVKILDNNDVVIIVQINQSKLCVRTREWNSMFEKVLKELKDFLGIKIKDLPVVDQLAACRHPKTNNFCRIIVKQVNNETVDAYFVDYGIEKAAPLEDICYINESLASIPATLTDISLEGYSDKPFSSNATNLIRTFIETKKKFYVILGNNGSAISLKTKENEMLVDIIKEVDKIKEVEKIKEVDKCSNTNTIKTGSTGTTSKIWFTDLPEYELPMGRNKLLCLNNDSLSEGAVTFCSSSEEVITSLTNMSYEINKYVETDSKSYYPEKYELCLAFYEGEWYRASIIDCIDNETFNVFYVDYGNSSNVAAKNIKTLPKELAKAPGFAVFCMLKGISNNSEEIKDPLLSKIQELMVEGQSYEVDVIKKIENSYVIAIPSVIEKLKSAGIRVNTE